MTLRVTEAEAQEIITEARALGAPGICIILEQLLQTTQLPNFSAALPTTVRYMLLSEGLVNQITNDPIWKSGVLEQLREQLSGQIREFVEVQVDNDDQPLTLCRLTDDSPFIVRLTNATPGACLVLGFAQLSK